MSIIRVHNLVRVYGSLRAVNDLSFEIAAGQVAGFVGANGAGKTTTMRIMATLEMPSAGRIEICGHDVVNFPREVRRCIGWMPDAFGRYEHMTVFEYLDFFGRAFGFRGSQRIDRIDEVMAFTDLAGIADRPMKELSKGMGQRLCLGRTLLNDPDVLILDEPAAGLDPKARVDLIRLIRLLAADGKTIFISSHILSELAEMCDTMLFIDNGSLVHYGSAESLTHHAHEVGALVTVEVAGDIEPLRDWCAMSPGVETVDEIKLGFRLRFEDAAADALAAQLRRMVESGLVVTEFRRERQRLEDAFVNILSAPRTAPLGVPPPLPGEREP